MHHRTNTTVKYASIENMYASHGTHCDNVVLIMNIVCIFMIFTIVNIVYNSTGGRWCAGRGEPLAIGVRPAARQRGGSAGSLYRPIRQIGVSRRMLDN